MKKIKSLLAFAALCVAAFTGASLSAYGYSGYGYISDPYGYGNVCEPQGRCYESKCGPGPCNSSYQGCYYENPYAGCNWTPRYGGKCCDCPGSPIRSGNFYAPQGGRCAPSYAAQQQMPGGVQRQGQPGYLEQYRQYLERNTQGVQGAPYGAARFQDQPQSQYGQDRQAPRYQDQQQYQYAPKYQDMESSQYMDDSQY